ncbi:MAG: aldo/keto reductase [Dictyoglomus sp.]|nr:aldo/keto reductase [Dictyoglomus sp.]MDW8188302.1 aldo/keto reductase [Dictyoglomus sp.]
MKYRRLGRTNIEVFPIAFGGIPIQRIEEEEAVKVVRRAIELGINLIDTARGYRDSEIKIGKALKGIDKKVYISTKSPNRTKDGIYEDVKISLKNLGVEKIDIYHLHGINDKESFNKVFSPDGAYYGLLRAKEEGLIDFIAVSSHSTDLLEELIATDKFDVVQLCYNFIETKVEEKIFPMALEKDIGIIAMKPMGGGVFPNPRLALKFALQKEFVIPDPGMETIEEVEENVKIALELSPLTPEEWEEIEKTKAELGPTFCRRCDYCQPCPQEIPISIIIRADSFIKRLSKDNISSGWFYDAYLKAQNCTRCGNCLPRCPYKLPIPDLIRENVKLVREYLGE